MTWLPWFVFGSAVGSFLNVCIYRLPREQSVVRPRSRCPACAHPIAWCDNVPLVSFLLLRGRCRHCRKPITWRYPAVELLAGLATVAVVSRFGVEATGLAYLALVYALIVASFVDLEFQIIPDEVSLGGLALGIVVTLIIPQLHGTVSRLLALTHAVIGLVTGGALLYLSGVLGQLLFRKESMGAGDVKLLAMVGAVLGWKVVTMAFFISPLLALIPGLLVLLVKRSHVIPYGPFLSMGVVVSLFFGEDLLRMTGMGEALETLWGGVYR